MDMQDVESGDKWKIINKDYGFNT